jgi:hypothetical protein
MTTRNLQVAPKKEQRAQNRRVSDRDSQASSHNWLRHILKIGKPRAPEAGFGALHIQNDLFVLIVRSLAAPATPPVASSSMLPILVGEFAIIVLVEPCNQ